MSDLSNYRKSYEKSELLESMIDENPMMQMLLKLIGKEKKTDELQTVLLVLCWYT